MSFPSLNTAFKPGSIAAGAGSLDAGARVSAACPVGAPVGIGVTGTGVGSGTVTVGSSVGIGTTVEMDSVGIGLVGGVGAGSAAQEIKTKHAAKSSASFMPIEFPLMPCINNLTRKRVPKLGA
jgi:hypothetical protein